MAEDGGRWPAVHIGSDVIDGVHVSTVWLLGINHQFMPGRPPLFYETMVFGGPLDGEQVRYSTEDEAIDGHNEMLRRVLLMQRLGITAVRSDGA